MSVLGTVVAVSVLGVRSIVLGIVDAIFLVALTSDLKSVRLRQTTLTVRPVETVWWRRRLTILFYRDRVDFDSQSESCPLRTSYCSHLTLKRTDVRTDILLVTFLVTLIHSPKKSQIPLEASWLIL